MEKETIQDLILRYGVILGKRSTEKQKKSFLRAASKQFEQEGFPVDITCVSASVLKQESLNTYNLYAGDFDKAECVFVTYYDTPLYQLLPKVQKAFHSNWSKGNFLMHMMLFLLLIIVFVGVLCTVVFPNLQKVGFLSVWGILVIASCAAGFFIISHMRGGIARQTNRNRNTSSLIALFTFAARLSECEKEKIAFALIDEGTRSELGLKLLADYIEKRKIIRIYLDTVSNGEQFQCFSNLALPDDVNLSRHPLVSQWKNYGDILLSSSNQDQEEVILQKEKHIDKNQLEQRISRCAILLSSLSRLSK